MKLNTLLLTSAATLMATSVAFAADLPSKKAAPSSGSVQVCKVGGMTGFTLPGSATCLSIGGRVVYQGNYDLDAASGDDAQDYTPSANYRVSFDAQTNTEIGVVRSFINLDGTYAAGSASTGVDKAYLQFAGFTAGKKSSLADVAGTTPYEWGSGMSQTAIGVDYRVSAGGLSFAVGIEDANNWNGSAADDPYAYNYINDGYYDEYITADRPDILAQVSGSAGPVSFKIAGVSHVAMDAEDVETVNGYALVGQAKYSMGDIGFIVYGGMSDAATRYTGNGAGSAEGYGVYIPDAYNGDTAKGDAIGGEVSFKAGKALFVISGRQNNVELDGVKREQTAYGAYLSYEVAKGLSIQPEWIHTDTKWTGGDDYYGDFEAESNNFYLTIQRDF